MNDGNKMIWGLIGGLLVGSMMKKRGSRNQPKGTVLAFAYLNHYDPIPLLNAIEEGAHRGLLIATASGQIGWNTGNMQILKEKNPDFRDMVERAQLAVNMGGRTFKEEKVGPDIALEELLNNVPMERLGPLVASIFGMDKLVQSLNELSRCHPIQSPAGQLLKHQNDFLTINLISDQGAYERFMKSMYLLVMGGDRDPRMQPVHISANFYQSLVLPDGTPLANTRMDRKVDRILFVTEEGQPDVPAFSAIPLRTTVTSNAQKVKSIAGGIELKSGSVGAGTAAQKAGDAIKKVLRVSAPNIMNLSAKNYRLLCGKQFAIDKGDVIFGDSPKQGRSRSPLVTGERQLMMLTNPIPIVPSGSFVQQKLVTMIVGAACGLRLNGGGFDRKLSAEEIDDWNDRFSISVARGQSPLAPDHPDHVSLLQKHDFKFHGILVDQQFIRSPDFQFLSDRKALTRKKDRDIQMMMSRHRKKDTDLGNYEIIFYFSVDGKSGSVVSTLKMRQKHGWFFLDSGLDHVGISQHLQFNPTYQRHVMKSKTPMFYYAPKHVSATHDDISGNYYVNPAIATFFVKCIQSIGIAKTRETCDSELIPHYLLFSGMVDLKKDKKEKKEKKEKKRRTKTIPPPPRQKPKAVPPVQQPVVQQIAEQIVEQGFTPVLEQKYEPAEEYLVIGDNIEDSIKIYEDNFKSTSFAQNSILNVMKEDLSNLYQDVFFNVKPWNQFSQMVDVKDISTHIMTLSDELTQNIALLDLSWPEIPSTVLNIGMEMAHPADLIRTMGGTSLFKLKSGPKKDRIILSGGKPATLETILISEYRDHTLVDFVVIQPQVRIEHGAGRVQKSFENLCIVYRLAVNTRTGKGQWEFNDALSQQLVRIWAAITSIFRNRDSAGRTSNPVIRTGGIPKSPGHKKNFIDPNQTIVRQTDVFLNPESDGLYEVVYVPPQTQFTTDSKRAGSGPSYRPDSLGHRYKRQDRLSDKQDYDIENRRVPVRPHYMNRSGRKYIPAASQSSASEQDYFWHESEKRPWVYYKVRTAIKGFQRRENGELEAFSLPYIVFTRVIESE